MNCALPHVIRAADDGDYAIVSDPWVQGMRHAPFSRGVDIAVYLPQMKLFVRRVLRSASTLIACNPENREHVFGYIVFSRPNVLHWIYVKKSYQGIGLGRVLFDAAALREGPIVATQASSGCFDKYDARTRETTRKGYFHADREIKVIFDPFFHMRPEHVPAREIQATA